MKDYFQKNIQPKVFMFGLLLTLVLSTASNSFGAWGNGSLVGAELQAKVDRTYGKIEFKMYSNYVLGTTSTYFWWRDGGQLNTTQWNEIDIETLPLSKCYQSNPIWETDYDFTNKHLWEGKHGDIGLYGRWVTYQMEWAPDHISWFHDGIQDRRINLGEGADPVKYINKAMRTCFNMWSQGNDSPNWLGNLDFNALQNKPVYMFVDYFKYYPYANGAFSGTPSLSIDFNTTADITNNFNKSTWAMSESHGWLNWSTNASGVVSIGNGNSALWMCVAYAGQERAPVGAEIPGGTATPVLTTITVTPATSTKTVGQTQQFIAAGKDQNGAAIAMTPTWTVTGGGTISASGLFTATAAGGPFTVKATSGTKSGTAQVTVTAAATGNTIPGKVEAENYSAYNNVQNTQMRAATTDAGGGFKMGYNDAGDWYDYSVNVQTAGNYTVTFRVANGGTTTGQFQLKKGTTVLTTVDVAPTGGWETFVTLTKTVNFSATGVQTIRLSTVKAGVDYNWFNGVLATNPVVNSVAFNPAAIVESGDTYAIAVTYSSTTANDVNVGFYTAAWGYVVGQTKTVAAGSGVLNFTITIPAATAVGTTYIWQTQIMPVGGTYLQRYAVAEKTNVQVTNLKSATVGINEPALGEGVVVYPSPVSSMLHLDGVSGFRKISIYNSVGQLVKQVQKGTEVLFNIDVQSLKKGMYYIELSNGAERVSKKIVKN